MTSYGYVQLYEKILKMIHSKLEQTGNAHHDINQDTDLMELLDSFALLDLIIEIEERTGVSADLAQMDIAEVMTVGDLVKEILRING